MALVNHLHRWYRWRGVWACDGCDAAQQHPKLPGLYSAGSFSLNR